MSAPLKLVVRLSKPKPTSVSSAQGPSNGDHPQAGLPRSPGDGRPSSLAPWPASGLYSGASPPLPPAKKHKSSSGDVSRPQHGLDAQPQVSRPPKLQLKLGSGGLGSSLSRPSVPGGPDAAHRAGGGAGDKRQQQPHSPSNDPLSLRVPIRLVAGAPSRSAPGPASSSRSSADNTSSKKRRSEASLLAMQQPGGGLGGSSTKKLKLAPAAHLSPPADTPGKHSTRPKPSRSKAGTSKKASDPGSQAFTSDAALEEVVLPRLTRGGAQPEAGPPPPATSLARAPVPPPTRQDLEHLVDKIQKRDTSDIFRDPVTEAIAPGYFSVISKPMDFTTIRQNISAGRYRTWDALEEDITLMFGNAMTYNTPDTPFYRLARTLLEVSRKLLELARQGVTNFRGRTAGIVRANNAKIAAEERAEKEAQQAALKAEKLAAQKAKAAASGVKTVALNHALGGTATAKVDGADGHKPRSTARPIVRENDGRRPLQLDENMRVTYKAVAELPAGKWGALVNGAAAEGMVFAADSHHLRLQQQQMSKDAYLTSLARFVLSCGKSVQDYVLGRMADCVQVEGAKPGPTPAEAFLQMARSSAGMDLVASSLPAFSPQITASAQQHAAQLNGLLVNRGQPLQDAGHRLGSIHPSPAAASSLSAGSSRTGLPVGLAPDHAALFTQQQQLALQQAQRTVPHFAAGISLGAGGAAQTLVPPHGLYQQGVLAPGANYPNMYNSMPGLQRYAHSGHKPHDVLRQ